jgi:hypothetical protein
MNRISVFAISLLSVVIALVACGQDPVRPLNEPGIKTETDNFQFQVTRVTNFSANLAYTWRNTGVTATVNQSSSITAGTAMLTILDANGAHVYARSLSDNGTFQTLGRGSGGDWRIELAPSSVTGTLNFRVQRGDR